MKICPKCNEKHTKNGTFCSRSCANSRGKMSDETKEKIRTWAKNNPRGYAVRTPEGEKRIREGQIRWRERYYKETPFESLGWDAKRNKILSEQKHKCSKCGIDSWMGQPLSLEIDHIDGDRNNNSRDNLEALCPNCHSLTPTFRSKNKNAKNFKVSDDILIEALKSESNIRQALQKVGLSPRGGNYKRANRLKDMIR